MTEVSGALLRVIDPHVHLCDMESGIYPHFADHPPGSPFSSTYALEDFVAEASADPEIMGAVHVEAFPTDPVRETEILQRIAETGAFPIVTVGHANLLAQDFEAVLDQHQAYPIFRGIRQVANIHSNPSFTQAKSDLLNATEVIKSLRLLGERGLSFDLQILGHQMARAAEVIAACVDTRFIINHAGLWTDRTLEGWRIWKHGLRLLAALPNTFIKISGLGMRDPVWTIDSIRPIVFEVIDAFTPQRTMFASNFPVDRKWSSYQRIWRSFDLVTAAFSAGERAQLFEETARRVYRIASPDGPPLDAGQTRTSTAT
jgi:predicted TIM-barrel fold metal-dependent hydrolase